MPYKGRITWLLWKWRDLTVKKPIVNAFAAQFIFCCCCCECIGCLCGWSHTKRNLRYNNRNESINGLMIQPCYTIHVHTFGCLTVIAVFLNLLSILSVYMFAFLPLSLSLCFYLCFESIHWIQLWKKSLFILLLLASYTAIDFKMYTMWFSFTVLYIFFLSLLSSFSVTICLSCGNLWTTNKNPISKGKKKKPEERAITLEKLYGNVWNQQIQSGFLGDKRKTRRACSNKYLVACLPHTNVESF